VPTDPTTMALNCIEGCGSGNAVKTWDAGSRTLTIKGLYVDGTRDYLSGGSAIVFTLTPFVNPSSADKIYFTWESFF